jgi:hypothetical protein
MSDEGQHPIEIDPYQERFEKIIAVGDSLNGGQHQPDVDQPAQSGRGATFGCDLGHVAPVAEHDERYWFTPARSEDRPHAGDSFRADVVDISNHKRWPGLGRYHRAPPVCEVRRPVW